MKIAILGSGSWGTALSVLVARMGHEVYLVGREPSEIESIRTRRENLRYLPGFAVPEQVEARLFEDAPVQADLWVVAVPSGAVSEVVSTIKADRPRVVLASKGLEPVSARLLSEVVCSVIPDATIAALSGPNLAIELVRGVPTVAVAACCCDETCRLIAETFNSPSFRVYMSSDVRGVELAGAFKNVLAIGAGLSDGLGFGDNTKGALIARGLHEMTRLGMALGAQMDTFFGIAGVGDLFATANSKLSRNYRVGYALGQGIPLDEILTQIGQVAEGVTTAQAAVTLSQRNSVQTPIFDAIYDVLIGKTAAKDAVQQLMYRIPKREGFYNDEPRDSKTPSHTS